MFIDLTVLALLALVTFLGYRKGFARQLVGIAAIVAVYFLAPPSAWLVRTVIFAEKGITFPGIEFASLVIAGVIIFVGVYLVARLLVASITAISERFEDIDAVLGAVFGGIKGLLIFYIVLCALVYVEAPLGRVSTGLGGQMEQSFLLAGVRRFNVITLLRYPELGNLRGAMMAAQDGEKAERNEALARLMQKEDFQAVVKDEKLLAAAQRRDYSTLLSDERVLRLLADEDFRTVLTETDWDELLDD